MTKPSASVRASRKRSLVWPDERVHLLPSHIDGAIVWLEKSCSAVTAAPSTPSPLVAAYAFGSENKPAAELAEAHRLSIDDRFSSIQPSSVPVLQGHFFSG